MLCDVIVYRRKTHAPFSMLLDMLAMKKELYGFLFYACSDRDIFPIYLLFSVLVLPDM